MCKAIKLLVVSVFITGWFVGTLWCVSNILDSGVRCVQVFSDF